MLPGLRAAEPGLAWTQLPPLPDPFGFAAPFAGVAGGHLFVAGGANFPKGLPWEGGKKAWHDAIYALGIDGTEWSRVGTLPRAIAYGVSVTTDAGVICIGGADGQRHYPDVFLLKLVKGRAQVYPLPALPKPVAYACGAALGNSVYLAGGTERPDATNALKSFWGLDLSIARPAWRELEAWPGPPRMLAVAGALEGSFYLFGGVDLYAGSDGAPARRYLRDAYRFRPATGWSRLAELPRAAAAAPSPAPVLNKQLLVISGDDGTLVNFQPKERHPGFPRDVLAFDPAGNCWSHAGVSPLSRATLPVVNWRGRAVLPNGEVRPGVRTPEVWSLEPARTPFTNPAPARL